MYITITGSKNNKDVYIYQSFRKEDGRPSSRIYKKLGKYNALLEEFNGDKDKLMAWAKNEAAKETDLYNQHNGKVIVEFSQASCIPLNEARSFYAGYLFLISFVFRRIGNDQCFVHITCNNRNFLVVDRIENTFICLV